MKAPLASQWLAGLTLLAASLCRAQPAPEEVVQPRYYRSASGRCVLSVDPTLRFGQGAADYQMECDGKAVWTARLPYTIRSANVANDGAVGGYSYSSGLRGFFGEERGKDSLRLLILDGRNGSPRLNQEIARNTSGALHAAPEPTVDGTLLDETGDRFVACLSAKWQSFRLSDGSPRGEIDVRSLLPHQTPNVRIDITAARLLPGTPLVILQYSPGAVGANFALISLDLPGTLLWSSALPGDAGDVNGRQDHAILETGADRFVLWSAAAREKISFRVTGAKTGWEVAEESRAPLASPPADSTELSNYPTLGLPTEPDTALKSLGSFHFPASEGSPPAIRAVSEFLFDRDGRLGFLRTETGHEAFLLIDPAHGGQVVREISLASLPLAASSVHLAWLEGSRWLLAVCGDKPPDNNATHAWTLDAATGAIAPLPEFNCLSLSAVAGAGDGRFVVLAVDRKSRSRDDFLLCFDRAGRRLWEVKGRYETLFSPADVTVLADGQTVAVLETIGDHLRLFDLADGRLRQSIDLKEAWGREPTYLSEISADPDGGVIIGDWQNEKRPYLRTDAAGREQAVIHPHFADGRPIKCQAATMRADPSGRLWVTDRASLLRLNDEGEVDLALGASPDRATLGRVSGFAVGDDGLLFAADAYTGAVHVFDQTGQPVRVCRPDPAPGAAEFYNLGIAPDGRLLMSAAGDGDSMTITEFSADGRRLGARQFPPRNYDSAWRLTADGKHLAMRDFGEIFLVDAATGETTLKVERQFDRRWLDEFAEGPFTAVDGSFLIVSRRADRSELNISQYRADGKPTAMFALPIAADEYCFAYSGRQIVTRQKNANRLLAFDKAGVKPTRGYTVDLPDHNAMDYEWEPYFVHGGGELWLVRRDTKTVARFQWPLP